MLTTYVAFLLALPPASAPPVHVAWEMELQIRLRANKPVVVATTGLPNYADGIAAARKDGKPVIVWVNVSPRPIDGAVHCQVSEFKGLTEPGVVVGIPQSGGWYQRIDLPATVSDEHIRALLRTQPRKLSTPAQQSVSQPVLQPIRYMQSSQNC